jgi:hypothetical protein
MKKINLIVCALAVCLLSACLDVCGFTQGDPNTSYTWSYSNNGTTSSGSFTTNQYGQASFDVPEGTDCNKLDLKVNGGSPLPVSSPEN